MHEHLGSFKHILTQKFHQNFINFEKPQKFGQNAGNAWWMNEKETYQRKKMFFETEKHLG